MVTDTIDLIVLDDQTTVRVRPVSIRVPAGETCKIPYRLFHADGETAYDQANTQLLLAVGDIISRQSVATGLGVGYFLIDVGDTVGKAGAYFTDIWLRDENFDPIERFQCGGFGRFFVTGSVGLPDQPVTVPEEQEPLAQGAPGASGSVAWPASMSCADFVASLTGEPATVVLTDGVDGDYTWDQAANIENLYFIGGTADNPATIKVAAGADNTGSRLRSYGVMWQSTTGTLCSGARAFEIDIQGGGMSCSANSSPGVLRLPAGFTHHMSADRCTFTRGGTAGCPIFLIGATLNGTFRACSFGPSIFRKSGAGSVVFNMRVDAACELVQTNVFVSFTPTVTYLGDSDQEPFTAQFDDDWKDDNHVSAPTVVAVALRQLARQLPQFSTGTLPDPSNFEAGKLVFNTNTSRILCCLVSEWKSVAWVDELNTTPNLVDGTFSDGETLPRAQFGSVQANAFMRITPDESGALEFFGALAGFDQNTDGRLNQVYTFGPNFGPGGARVDTDEAATGQSIETHYHPATDTLLENHVVVFISSDGTTTVRAIDSLFNDTTKKVINTLAADETLISGPDNTPYFDFLITGGPVLRVNGSAAISHQSNDTAWLKQKNADGLAFESLIYLDSLDRVHLGGGVVTIYSPNDVHFEAELKVGGFIHNDNGSHEQTTVGAPGGASALPASPTKYLQIKSAGQTYVIPLFAVS